MTSHLAGAVRVRGRLVGGCRPLGRAVTLQGSGHDHAMAKIVTGSRVDSTRPLCDGPTLTYPREKKGLL